LQPNIEDELRAIIKKYGYNKEKFIEFKKKYKYVDMAHYMHKAHLEEVKAKEKEKIEKPKKEHNTEEKLTSFAKNLLSKQKLLNGEEEFKVDSYLKACMYNNSDLIKAFLLTAKSKMFLLKIYFRR